MAKDKKVLYIISFLMFAVLLLALIFSGEDSGVVTACILVPLTALTYVMIKKGGAPSINKKEVLLVSVLIGAIYILLLQMSGTIFGYYHNPYMVTTKTIPSTVLPIAAIIVCTELIRRALVVQKNFLVSLLAYLSCVVAEALSFSGLANISNMNNFMDFFGMTLFPAIIANIYYHYSAKSYGALPNIAFRFIITLYVYFVPQVTALSDAIVSMTKLALPLIMLATVSALYEKKPKKLPKKANKFTAVGLVFTLVVTVLVAMLVSCQFTYGAIVIATGSMTGEINKGDVIIYEEYTNQRIDEGQVIVFRQNDRRVIHRVVGIEMVDGEPRYYTKGDANQSMDVGYRLESDIVGLTDFKIAYIGYPTLWLRELLEGSN